MITVHDAQARSDSNRREYPRFPYRVPLHFQVCTPQSIEDVCDGYTTNVSQGGLSFVTTAVPPLSSVIMLDVERQILVYCVALDNTVIEVNGQLLAKVVRVINDKHDDHYKVGVAFIMAGEETREDVARALSVLSHTVLAVPIAT